MVAISSVSALLERHSAALADTAEALAKIEAKSPKAAEALAKIESAFNRAVTNAGTAASETSARGQASGNGNAGSVPSTPTTPATTPEVSTPVVNTPAINAPAAAAQPVVDAVTARKPAVPPGQANAASPATSAAATPAPKGNAYGLQQPAPVPTPPPTDTTAAPTPTVEAEPVATTTVSTVSIERATQLYQAVDTREIAPALQAARATARTVIAALGETAHVAQRRQMQLADVAQRTLEAAPPARDADTRKSEERRRHMSVMA